MYILHRNVITCPIKGRILKMSSNSHLLIIQSNIFLHTAVKSGEGNGTPLQYSCLENPMDGGAWQAAVHGVAEGQTRLSNFTFTFHFHALEKEMATHSSVLAWRIPGTGHPGGMPSMGSHRVGHDQSDSAQKQQKSLALALSQVSKKSDSFTDKENNLCGQDAEMCGMSLGPQLARPLSSQIQIFSGSACHFQGDPLTS